MWLTGICHRKDGLIKEKEQKRHLLKTLLMILVNQAIFQTVSDKLIKQHIVCFTEPQVSKFFPTRPL